MFQRSSDPPVTLTPLDKENPQEGWGLKEGLFMKNQAN
jgi:hypothetical protein